GVGDAAIGALLPLPPAAIHAMPASPTATMTNTPMTRGVRLFCVFAVLKRVICFSSILQVRCPGGLRQVDKLNTNRAAATVLMWEPRSGPGHLTGSSPVALQAAFAFSDACAARKVPGVLFDPEG